MHDETGHCTQLAPCACLKTDYPVSFALFALARSQRAKVAGMLADIGLFPGQEILLMQLAAKDGEPQKSLCDNMGLDHSTIAKSLQRLEREGLIERRKCPEDGRVSQVFLTDRGREITAAIAGVWSELERETVALLTDGEKEQLLAMARKLAPAMA